MSLVLLSFGLLLLAQAQTPVPQPASASPPNGMVRLVSASPSADGMQEVWEIEKPRYDALPAWDPAASRIPLTYTDALKAAEASLTRRQPDVKAWLAINMVLLNDGDNGRAWFYRFQLVPERAPASVVLPPATTGRFTVLVLLDGTVVESKRINTLVGTGIGPGTGAGAGTGVFNVGGGVSPPRVIQDPPPHYTPDAMRAKVEGTVRLSCVVNTDGQCEDIRVIQSLDTIYGLDDEAIRTLRLWRFLPGTLAGEPVKVRVVVQLSFNLRK